MKTEKPLKAQEMRILRGILREKTGLLLQEYLIEQAFTRSSYARSYGGGSNENFEFIGDTILGYHVVRKLFEYYGTIHTDEENCYYDFRANEQDLSRLKSNIVSNRTLAGIIDEWDVCQYLIVGKQDIHNEIDKQEKIKADLFEAIIGACAVQLNWNQENMGKVISRVLPIDDFISAYGKQQFRAPEFRAENAINTLKELAEHERCSFPKYDFRGPEVLGYDKNGNPIWTCDCEVQSAGIKKCVFAHSKRDAKKFAAYLVLCDMFELPNEYGPSSRLIIWGYDGEKLIVNPPRDF